MPQVYYECTVCGHLYRGGEGLNQATLCEKQIIVYRFPIGTTFTLSRGFSAQVIAHTVRFHAKKGHLPVYKLKIGDWESTCSESEINDSLKRGLWSLQVYDI